MKYMDLYIKQIRAISICVDSIDRVATYLDQTLRDTCVTRNPDAFTCRISWSGCHIGISVSCPPDKNRQHDTVIETALWDTTNDCIMYNEDLGYDDVITLYTSAEVLEEIERIQDLVTAADYDG
jgi:hypothetical protein